MKQKEQPIQERIIRLVKGRAKFQEKLGLSEYQLRRFSPVLRDAVELRKWVWARNLMLDHSNCQDECQHQPLPSTIYFSGKVVNTSCLVEEDGTIFIWLVESKKRHFIYLATEQDLEVSVAKQEIVRLNPAYDPEYFEFLDVARIVGESKGRKGNHYNEMCPDSPIGSR